MVRAFYLAYAALCYAIFFATFLYLIAFVGNFPFAQPTVDFARDAPPGRTLLIDVGLIALCWMPNSAISPTSISCVRPGGASRAKSTVGWACGKLPT